MKDGIHPDYRPVVFHDTSAGERWIMRSTIETSDTTVWTDGREYPLAKVEVSNLSHPYYTGKMKLVDTAGRVERYQRRYAKRGDTS
jgi:large subunit ribosomal protein L31